MCGRRWATTLASLGGSLGLRRHRVGLQQRPALGRRRRELVAVARPARRRRGPPRCPIGPSARASSARRTPVVPVADHRHTRRRSAPTPRSAPRGRRRSRRRRALGRRATPTAPVGALAEQVEIELTDRPSDVGHRLHSRGCPRPCAAEAPNRCRSEPASRPASTVPGRARADAVVGVPAAGRGRHRRPTSTAWPRAGPGRPRGRRVHDLGTSRRRRRRGRRGVRVLRTARRPAVAPPDDDWSRGWPRPTILKLGVTLAATPLARRLEAPTSCTPTTGSSPGRPTRWRPSGRAARRHDPRHRARPPRRPRCRTATPADDQRDRVVADLPGPIEVIACSRFMVQRGDRRLRAAVGEGATSCPTASTPVMWAPPEAAPTATRAARRRLGARPVREGLPGAGPGDRPTCATAAGHPLRDRRTRRATSPSCRRRSTSRAWATSSTSPASCPTTSCAPCCTAPAAS